jgi:hypothetical protein
MRQPGADAWAAAEWPQVRSDRSSQSRGAGRSPFALRARRDGHERHPCMLPPKGIGRVERAATRAGSPVHLVIGTAWTVWQELLDHRGQHMTGETAHLHVLERPACAISSKRLTIYAGRPHSGESIRGIGFSSDGTAGPPIADPSAGGRTATGGR